MKGNKVVFDPIKGDSKSDEAWLSVGLKFFFFFLLVSRVYEREFFFDNDLDLDLVREAIQFHNLFYSFRIF